MLTPEQKNRFRQPLQTIEQATAFIRWLCENGIDFHFDDSPETVINHHTGERLFADEDCRPVRDRVNDLFRILPDPFDVLCAEHTRANAPETTQG